MGSNEWESPKSDGIGWKTGRLEAQEEPKVAAQVQGHLLEEFLPAWDRSVFVLSNKGRLRLSTDWMRSI